MLVAAERGKVDYLGGADREEHEEEEENKGDPHWICYLNYNNLEK